MTAPVCSLAGLSGSHVTCCTMLQKSNTIQGSICFVCDSVYVLYVVVYAHSASSLECQNIVKYSSDLCRKTSFICSVIKSCPMSYRDPIIHSVSIYTVIVCGDPPLYCLANLP